MIPAVIGDLQERVPPLDVPPLERLVSRRAPALTMMTDDLSPGFKWKRRPAAFAPDWMHAQGIGVVRTTAVR
jgi:hypothetical protein